MAPRDRVDIVQEEWSEAWPDLSVSGLSITARLRFVQKYLEQELEADLAKYELSYPNFLVLATLRRRNPPYQMSQRMLMDQLGLTSGTISVRLDRLAEFGLVERRPDLNDRRGSIALLTAKGATICESVFPEYAANEDRLLLSLTADEQAVLATLLRKLLIGLEGEAAPGAARFLGLGLEPPHVAYEMRRAVGLQPLAGLLAESVVPDGLGAAAGIREGDLLVSVGGIPLHSVATLYHALSEAQPHGSLMIGAVRGAEELTLEIQLAAEAVSEPPDNSASRTRRRHPA